MTSVVENLVLVLLCRSVAIFFSWGKIMVVMKAIRATAVMWVVSDNISAKVNLISLIVMVKSMMNKVMILMVFLRLALLIKG